MIFAEQKLWLFKRSRENVWYIEYETDEGKRKQISTKCTLKADAIVKLSDFKEMLVERKKGIYLSEFENKFLEFAKNNFAHYTRNIYKLVVREMIRIVGDLRINKYTMRHIDQYKSSRQETLLPRSVNRELQALRSLMYLAVRWEFLKHNPFANVKMLRVPESKPKFLTRTQAAHFINTITEGWLRDLVFFAINTGLRRAEITHLTWDKVDFENRILIVQSDANFKTKAGKSRIVPMNEGVFDLLNGYNATRKFDLVFNFEGKKIREDRLTKGFKRFLKIAELDTWLTFHHLRHTFASLLVQDGVSIYEVQKLLGHSTITVTEIYAHLQPNRLHEAVGRISLNMGEPKKPNLKLLQFQ
ncbi:MAG: site-specific integrase [Bacteroidota bacterium]